MYIIYGVWRVCGQVWPVLTGATLAGVPPAEPAPVYFEQAGILAADDPLWTFLTDADQKQVAYYKATTFKEAAAQGQGGGGTGGGGGVMNSSIAHGDPRGENIFFPVARTAEGVDTVGGGGGPPAFIDFQLMRRFCPAVDCIYFTLFSTTIEYRRKYELKFMNIYYDTLLESAGQTEEQLCWEVFCLEMQWSLIFFTTAFVFLTPDVCNTPPPPFK